MARAASKFERTVALFASGKARRVVARALADEIEALVDEGFAKRSDPYGNPWADRVEPTGDWPILEKSGAMRRSFLPSWDEGRAKIRNRKPYTKFHQTGTSRMVARKVVPDAGKPLPPKWRKRLERAARRALKKAR